MNPKPPGLITSLRALPRAAWILFAGTFINRFGSFVIPFLVIYLRGQPKALDLVFGHETTIAQHPVSEPAAHWVAGHDQIAGAGTETLPNAIALFLPLVGSVTRFREGPRPWNRFENEASEVGQFGGIVAGSVCPKLVEHSTLER